MNKLKAMAELAKSFGSSKCLEVWADDYGVLCCGYDKDNFFTEKDTINVATETNRYYEIKVDKVREVSPGIYDVLFISGLFINVNEIKSFSLRNKDIPLGFIMNKNGVRAFVGDKIGVDEFDQNGKAKVRTIHTISKLGEDKWGRYIIGSGSSNKITLGDNVDFEVIERRK